MQAIRIHQHGGGDVLRYESAPMPEPGPGQARIKVAATGLNFVETYQRSGAYQVPLPFTPGGEASGTVDAVGPGVTEFKAGDRVVSSSCVGAYAEYALAPAAKLVTVPKEVDLRIAAAVILQGMTAHYLTHSTYALRPADVALVHAAAGGTGALLVQMAKKRGARVIGTVSTEEKAAIARASGADEVIFYTQTDFAPEVKRLTDGKGVHVVYDSVGKTTFEQSLDCLKTRGYMVLFGQSSGAVPPLSPQVLNAKGGLFLTRPSLVHYTQTRDEIEWRIGDIFGWIASNALTVRIDRTFALADAAQAHAYIEGRQTKGKVLLVP